VAALAISILVVIALAILFAWLARRAWRSGTSVVKWAGVIVAGLLTLVAGLVAVVSLVGFFKLYAPSGGPPSTVQVASTPDQLAKGERYAHLCVGCHSTTNDLPLVGGENFAEGFGTIVPPNLTPGGPLKDWSDGEIIRAIREGVDKDRKPLLIMPSEEFHPMSDDDVAALVAYLRSQPAVSRDTPENAVNLIGALVLGSGMFSTSAQPPITAPVVAPPAGNSAQFGRYLVDIGGCRSCHGEQLTGGTPSGFGPPPGPNIVAIIHDWSDAQYISTIRTGTDPAGHVLDPEQMPWRQLSATFTDDELRAIYTYVRSLS
jgi:cytochrome c553